jgi:hypothetical protein
MYRRSPGKLRAAVDHFNTLDLDHVVHLGDFIDKDWELRRPAAHGRRPRHPWRFVLGNHDFSVDDDKKALVAARLGMPARYYSLQTRAGCSWPSTATTSANTAGPPVVRNWRLSQRLHRELFAGAPDWDGGIGETQLKWIDATLADAERARPEGGALLPLPDLAGEPAQSVERARGHRPCRAPSRVAPRPGSTATTTTATTARGRPALSEPQGHAGHRRRPPTRWRASTSDRSHRADGDRPAPARRCG